MLTLEQSRPQLQFASAAVLVLGLSLVLVRQNAWDANYHTARGHVNVEDRSGDTVLQAGTRINQTPHRLGPKQLVNVSSALAWQHGRLVFEMTPLSEVLEQLQRDRPGFIQAADEGVGNLKVSGTVQRDRLDEGVQSLAQAFALDVVRYSDYWGVLKARR